MQPSMAMKLLNGKSLVVGERVYVPNSDPENSDDLKTATDFWAIAKKSDSFT